MPTNLSRFQMLGAMCQELLSGIRTAKQFVSLRDKLRAFPDLPLVAEDYELAADFFNQCRLPPLCLRPPAIPFQLHNG